MKPTFTDLTLEQRLSFGNGCGLEARFLRVPQFIFNASCKQHDFNYTRGGGLKDKAKADWDFFTAMLGDATMSSKPIFYSIMSIVYLIGVSLNPVAFVAFQWGSYKTLDEILEYDRLKKEIDQDK